MTEGSVITHRLFHFESVAPVIRSRIPPRRLPFSASCGSPLLAFFAFFVHGLTSQYLHDGMHAQRHLRHGGGKPSSSSSSNHSSRSISAKWRFRSRSTTSKFASIVIPPLPAHCSARYHPPHKNRRTAVRLHHLRAGPAPLPEKQDSDDEGNNDHLPRFFYAGHQFIFECLIGQHEFPPTKRLWLPQPRPPYFRHLVSDF